MGFAAKTNMKSLGRQVNPGWLLSAFALRAPARQTSRPKRPREVWLTLAAGYRPTVHRKLSSKQDKKLEAGN
jgi:hypothetical protein